MEELAPYGVTGGGAAAGIALLRWLYILLVRGLAEENKRLTARLAVTLTETAERVAAAQKAEQEWRARAFDAGWVEGMPPRERIGHRQ
jgi:hypothetical protein